MKKIAVIIFFLGFATLTFGQSEPNENVNRAELAFTNGELDIAKAQIDRAFRIDANGAVSSVAQNWLTRGKIYKALYLDESADYQGLVNEKTLGIAMDSFNKVEFMEKEDSQYITMANEEVSQLYGSIIDFGTEKYMEDDFKGAYHHFMAALEVQENDTTALVYAGVSVQQADMIDEALTCFQTLADNGQAKMTTYKTMIYLYRTEKEDLEGALKIVKQALAFYPNNMELMQEKIGTLIMMERVNEAVSELEDAIKNDPENYVYYYFSGTLYDYQEDRDNALIQYKKSLELNPNYYEASFNIGVIHYNEAREIYSELNKLSIEEHKKEESSYVEKAAVYLRKALPYFEKAVEVRPEEDIQLLETLVGIYNQLKMSDEAAALENKIKALTGR